MPKYKATVEELINLHGDDFTPEIALIVAIQLLNSIEALHQVGYCHNDLKVSNFMTDSSDLSHFNVYLIDFGFVSKYMDNSGKNLKR